MDQLTASIAAALIKNIKLFLIAKIKNFFRNSSIHFASWKSIAIENFGHSLECRRVYVWPSSEYRSKFNPGLSRNVKLSNLNQLQVQELF